MASDGSGAQGALSRTVLIAGELGLHARPAARFVKFAASFDAEIEVTAHGVTVSGRSIMGLMMLAAAPGSSIEVTADGAAAGAAGGVIAVLVDGKFDVE